MTGPGRIMRCLHASWYTPEFKDQAVRYVFEEIGPDESRYADCERLRLKVNVKPATLYGWVKLAAAGRGPFSERFGRAAWLGGGPSCSAGGGP